MLFDDSYKTIAAPAEGFFKDKGSKFHAYAFPIRNEEDAKAALAQCYEMHPKAVHHCYAYRLGTDRMTYKLSDDGEPSGTAGRPILNTLFSKDVTKILVVVVRYFGGTLLGVPGLINAYKTVTEEVLATARIIEKHFTSTYRLKFAYIQMNEVMKIVKDMELPVLSQSFEMECELTLEVRQALIERFITRSGNVEGLVVELV